ncbi:hypothetical protein TorRG33x02_299840 [Trema orientale]|uniref:Uncharacterized protein n=1 Tax=Trema orientale TaxID=63057 RepID=A0A2P5C2T1_TREOI|nr:hypothetical protein TorRG33x02_299840 [Trema orientale]
MERVLGHHSVRLGGCGRSPSGSTATSDMDSSEPHHPTYDELAECLTSTQQQRFEVMQGLNKCRQVLREHNLMPPPRSNTTVSDQNSGPMTHIPPTTYSAYF